MPLTNNPPIDAEISVVDRSTEFISPITESTSVKHIPIKNLPSIQFLLLSEPISTKTLFNPNDILT